MLVNPQDRTMAGSSILAGRYRIENPPIGEGGMGVVYKAFDTVTKRFVAVKTLKGATDHNAIEMFHREWGVLARLCHPNIIDILDIGEFAENQWRQPYFVMPMLPGATLDKLIKNAGQRLTPERTVEIVSQACRGLQAAHDQGVVHRDIKPSNLFVMEDDTVKIIDFGVVHLTDSETKTGVKGTLQYMSPEQLDLKSATARSDIWSLGVVCYEALTGRKPFEGKTAEELIDAVRSRMPVPASDLNPAVNAQISQTVQRALAKEPYHRFANARDFADLLQRSVRNERIEVFDRNRILPRINRVKKALNEGDYQFAMEIVTELESEGNIDPEISLLRIQAEQAARAKTIHQLLESARTRMEEEEYPLALQKVQSVLNLEPSNVDALALKSAIEQKRSSTQIEKWQQIARQHADNKLYTKARQAIDEVLHIDPSYQPAKDLLAEIGSGEQQVAKLRREKQELYDSALKSYRNGEISTALTKLERIIEMGKLAPAHPNTEAQYLAFYEQIRSERDELRNAYNEGKRAIEVRDFAKALEICRTVLSRRPREPLFQALKIEAEDLQRQEDSAAIARVHSRIEAESDLDRKCVLLKDAAQQFPEEKTFQSSYKIVKERRDLVNSIVARARHYESQGQFLEASNQWDVLRSIYSQYPGLDFELQRLSRKQEESLRNELAGAAEEQPGPNLETSAEQQDMGGGFESRNELPPPSAPPVPEASAPSLLAPSGPFISAPSAPPAPAASAASIPAPSAPSASAASAAAGLGAQSARSLLHPGEARYIIPPREAAEPGPQLESVPREFETLPATRILQSPPAMNAAGYQSSPELVRDTRSDAGRRRLPVKRILIAAVALIVISGAIFFAWMLHANSGSHSFSANSTPHAAPAPATPRNQAGQTNASTSAPASANAASAALSQGAPPQGAPPQEAQNQEAQNRPAVAATVSFHFDSSPAAAEAIVDSDESLKCTTPCDVPLRYGRHTFTISAPDHLPAQGIIEIPDEKDRFITLQDDLQTVRIYSIPDRMAISVDGQPRGQTPLTLRLRSGEHKVTSSGDKSYEGSIQVARGGMNIFTINAKPSSQPNAAHETPAASASGSPRS